MLKSLQFSADSLYSLYNCADHKSHGLTTKYRHTGRQVTVFLQEEIQDSVKIEMLLEVTYSAEQNPWTTAST